MLCSARSFFIGEEFFFQPLIFFIALSSRPRSGKREGPDLSVLDFYESFRGCTGDLDIITREVEHVRRRVRRSEDAVRIEEASLKISFEPVGENELEEVSLVDIMFDLLDFLTVRFLIEERAELGFQVAGFRLGTGFPKRISSSIFRVPVRLLRNFLRDFRFRY